MSVDPAAKDRQIAELQNRIKALEATERDFGTFILGDVTRVKLMPLLETLKSQAKSQAAEYDRLADSYNEATGVKRGNKKAD